MECEHDLIRRVINGENELFEQIVIEYQHLVYTVCLNIVKNSHDAENMAQETFISAYYSLSGFRGGKFKSWLCRIAVNKSIDFKRKQSKFLFTDDLDFLESEDYDSESVDKLLESKEITERINGILPLLPEKYSAVIKAFYYDGLSVKEIAERRNLPPKTVETQLYRAKKLIKERWGGHDV